MTEPVLIRYVDAWNSIRLCSTSRAHFTAAGLNWRTFVITGYTEDELYRVFGENHPMISEVAEYVKNKKKDEA